MKELCRLIAFLSSVFSMPITFEKFATEPICDLLEFRFASDELLELFK